MERAQQVTQLEKDGLRKIMSRHAPSRADNKGYIYNILRPRKQSSDFQAIVAVRIVE